jgi:ethanolamine ammonia-lyase large subunit
MQITVSGQRFHDELKRWLIERIDKHSSDIVAGVDVAVYKERVAHVRALKDVLAELPAVLKKAKE